MIDRINWVFDIYYAAFQGFCLQHFSGSFFEYRGKKHHHNGFCVAVLYTLLSLCANKLLFHGHEDIGVIESQIFTFCLIVLLAVAFYKSARAITCYLAITFMAVSQISFFVAHSVFKIGHELFRVWVWCIEKAYITDSNMVTVILGITAIALQILMYGIYSLLCFWALKGIAQSFRGKDYPISRTELYFLLAPSLVGELVCVMLRIIVVAVENGIPELLYDSHPILLLVIPVILILCLLSIIYSVKLLQNMIALNREKNSKVILEKQVESLQGQITEMEHIYSDIRGMKHDIGTTIAVITRLVEKGENTELQNYLSELNQTFDDLETRYKTGNAVVDTLLNMKYHEMTRTMPEVKLYADKLFFFDELMIQSYDIGVIIGNVLDNAMDACRKVRGGRSDLFIRISSFSKGEMFFIKIENSFDGKLVIRKREEFPMTTKQDKKVHGVGLVNIKNIAEKYHGGVDWRVEDKTFILLVMIKNGKEVRMG